MVSWRQKAYEELPALSVRGSELRRSLRLVTVAWMFGITWMTCITGSRMNYFGRMIGFGDFHFGLLGALPFMAKFIQLAATMVIERTGLRKYQFITCASVHRILWACVALVPLFVPTPSALATWLILGILAVSWSFEAMATPAWQTWMGDMIPKRIRGRYLATRGFLTRLIQIPVVVFLAVYISYALQRGEPMTAAAQPALLYSLVAVFLLASICGLVDILCFLRIREVVRSVPDGPREPAIGIHAPRGAGGRLRLGPTIGAAVDQLLLDPLRDLQFRRFVVYGAVVTFAQAVSNPFFIRHLVEGVGMGPVAIDVLFMGLGPIVAMVSVRLWGGLVDRWGRRPVLVAATSLTVFSVLPYFFVSRHTPSPVWFVGMLNGVAGWIGQLVGANWAEIFTGAHLGAWLIMCISLTLGACGWSGVFLAQGTIIFGFADGKGRSRYVSACAVVMAIGGVAGGLVGGGLASQLHAFRWDAAPLTVGPFIWNNWHAVFLLSFLARITALLMLIRLPDPGSGSLRAMVRHMGSSLYNGLSIWLNSPIRFGAGRQERMRKKATRRKQRDRHRRAA
jgi:MFS family permease